MCVDSVFRQVSPPRISCFVRKLSWKSKRHFQAWYSKPTKKDWRNQKKYQRSKLLKQSTRARWQQSGDKNVEATSTHFFANTRRRQSQMRDTTQVSEQCCCAGLQHHCIPVRDGNSCCCFSRSRSELPICPAASGPRWRSCRCATRSPPPPRSYRRAQLQGSHWRSGVHNIQIALFQRFQCFQSFTLAEIILKMS